MSVDIETMIGLDQYTVELCAVQYGQLQNIALNSKQRYRSGRHGVVPDRPPESQSYGCPLIHSDF